VSQIGYAGSEVLNHEHLLLVGRHEPTGYHRRGYVTRYTRANGAPTSRRAVDENDRTDA
jgi:hypothetical protein